MSRGPGKGRKPGGDEWSTTSKPGRKKPAARGGKKPAGKASPRPSGERGARGGAASRGDSSSRPDSRAPRRDSPRPDARGPRPDARGGAPRPDARGPRRPDTRPRVGSGADSLRPTTPGEAILQAAEDPQRARPMVIYGRNPVREALRGKRRVRRIWATQAASEEGWDARVTIVDPAEITERAGSENHQGVAALVDPYPYADASDLLLVKDALLVALDEVTDPQNVGAIARTAEAVGATGLILPERRSAEVTPAVCKASAGAVEHLNVAQVRNLADFLVEAKAAGCWVYGAAAGARTNYDQPDYTGSVVAVLGAEGKGLRPRVASMCDDLVSLPLLGHVASLNVSATGAVLLYEMLQQRLDAST